MLRENGQLELPQYGRPSVGGHLGTHGRVWEVTGVWEVTWGDWEVTWGDWEVTWEVWEVTWGSER